jgi:hypothetical protein
MSPFELETARLANEKVEACGGIAVAMSTSDESFAVDRVAFIAESDT